MPNALNFDKLPSALMSREGWSDLLEIQRPAEPHLHQIEPTNHCPYTCIMCPRTNLMTRPLGFMDLDLYRKVMEEVAGFAEPVRSREIELFHFGESLLHPEIHEMVALASELKLNVTLSVNAPHLTPERIDRILAGNPYRLIISFDGYDRESYQRLRGKAADYDKAVRHIDYLASLMARRDFSTRISIRMIRLYENEPYVQSFRKQWESQGFEVEIRPFFAWSEKDLVALGEVEKYPPGMPCPFPWQYVVVQWDGRVVPCCRDFNAENSLGNVKDASLREIWNNRAYMEFRNQHRSGCYGENTFCRRCMEIYFTDPDTHTGRTTRRCPRCRAMGAGKRQGWALCDGILPRLESGVVESDAGRLELTKHQRIFLFLMDRCCCGDDLRRRTRLDFSAFDVAVTDLTERNIIREIIFDAPATPNKSLHADWDLLPETLPSIWDKAMKRTEDTCLLICDGDDTTFSYSEAASVVDVLSARLALAGVKPGDRVASTARQSAELFMIFWAATRIGAVFVPIDPRLSDSERTNLIQRIEPKVFFSQFQPLPNPGKLKNVEYVVLDNIEDSDSLPAARLANWMEAGVNRPVPTPCLDDESPAVILFTSGTTGESKGVVLSHGALCRSAALMVDSYGWSHGDVLLSLGDFHTMSGLRNPCIAVVLAGATAVVAPPESRANALVIAETVKRRRVTLITTVPNVLRQFVYCSDRLGDGKLSSLRQVLCTASSLNPKDAADFRKRFQVPVYNYYGLTETAGICTGILPMDESESAGSIGKALGSLIMIDVPDGSIGSAIAPGELLVFSENLMLEYFGDPVNTERAFASGFYHTGDLAWRDGKGFIRLEGRKGDAIKNAHGEFLHPRTIERILEAQDEVLEVGACGLRVGTEQEELVAAVVPRKSVTDFEKFLYDLNRSLMEHLGNHRLPARMVMIDSLPRGTNGKLLRTRLRQRLEKDRWPHE